VAAGKTPGDLEDEVPAAVERVRLLVGEFESRGARYMNPGCVGDELAVADVRAVLLELRRLRALAVDPANTWLVTVKLPKNPAHDPRAKRTGPCPFSNECTDVTGEHHSFLTGAEGLEALRADGTHITRTERLQRSPDFLRVTEVTPLEFEVPRVWRSNADIPDDVDRVRDSFSRVWERQFLKLADGSPQWRLAGGSVRFGHPIPLDSFPVTEVD
jgi:hypothetical protein